MVLVPLDRVEPLPLEVEEAAEDGAVAQIAVGGDTEADQADAVGACEMEIYLSFFF